MYRYFDLEWIPPTPWKNGGGTTQEIARWPADSDIGDFDWRVSIAAIEASGTFSRFEGIDRTILLLDGAGVRLHSAGGEVDHRLDTPYEPFAFSGDVDVHCEILGAESRDFNVMSRRGSIRFDVATHRSEVSLRPAACGALFVASGVWRSAGEPRQLIPTGCGIWWVDEALAWTLIPDRNSHASSEPVLIAVRFARLDPLR